MNRNLVIFICLLVVFSVSGCSMSLVEKSDMESKLERETCQRNYDKIASLIGEKSGAPVTIQDPKGFLQGQTSNGKYQIGAGNANSSYQSACKEKPENVRVSYFLQKSSGFPAPYYFKFVDAEADWFQLDEGINPSASATRPLSDEPPELTLAIDKLVLSWAALERTVSDENIAVTIHSADHSSFPEIIYSVANSSRQFVTLKGISVMAGNITIDQMYPRPQALAPQREFKKQKLKSANRLPKAAINVHSPNELDQMYTVNVSVLYEINGVDRTLFKEFSLPLRSLVGN